MKKYCILLIFVALMMISSVNATDINSTNFSNSYLSEVNNPDQELISIENNDYSIDSSKTFDFEENLNFLSESNNVKEIYSSSSSSNNIVFDFESDGDLENWTSTGATISSGGYEEGNCVAISPGKYISKTIDWNNVDKIEFWTKGSAANSMLTASIGTTSLSGGRITLGTNWVNYTFDTTSFSDSSDLKFTSTRGTIYIDSVILTLKQIEVEDIYANFTSDVTEGFNTLTVQFNDVSTGNPTSWFWDFGDETNDTTQNPIHTYTTPGYYTVTLTINGDTSIVKNNFITVSSELTADFTNDDEGYINSPIKFEDASEGYPTSWLWNFGDGSYSTLQNPTHYYTNAGNYTVTLTISSKYNSTNKTKEVNIYNLLSADFTIQYMSSNGVLFNDKSSGDNIIYLWDLGDGTTSTNKDPNYNNIYGTRISHAYSPGTYIVSLTVSDGFTTFTKSEVIVVDYKSAFIEEFDSFENSTDGWTFSDGTEIRSDQTETVQFYNDGKYSVFISNTNEYMEKEVNFDNIDYFKFDAIANPNLGGTQSFAIYIDDNLLFSADANARSWKNIPGDTSTPNILDTSNINGAHKLKVQSTGGYNIYIDSFEFGSYNHYLANFTTSITKIEGDEITVAFKDASTGTMNSWLWNFGDGTTSTDHNPTHTFTKGDHTVSLTIYRDGIKMASVTNYLNLALPTIASTGEAYATLQDAINAAGENDVIDIPDIGAAFTENLVINKTLTLNFNGVTLNAKDTNQALINVTDGANVIVNNINIGSNAILSTTTDSTLNITDSAINVNLALNEGNINLLDDSFTNSIITVLANVNINNAEISNGAVVVNGGKSKIFNTTLTGSDVAITQTAGELDVISNLITDNTIGVNVTGGKTNMEYNLIYANAKFGLVYVGDNVTNANNWWGATIPDYASGENLSDKYRDIFRQEADSEVDITSWLELNINAVDSIMGINKEYPVNVYLNENSDGNTITGYLKTITLDFVSDGGDILNSAIIENGIGQTTLLTTNADVKNVNVTREGRNYALNSDIVSKTNVNIDVAGDLVEGATATVTIEVPKATGNITLIIDGASSSVALDNSQYVLTMDDLTAGKHSIFAVYEGNDIFNSVFNSTTFDVTAKEIVTSIIKITDVDGNLTVNGILKDSKDNALANEVINYQIGDGDKQNTTTNADGVFTLTGVNGATIKVSYSGNDTIVGSNDSITLSDIASKDETNKTISDLEKQLKDAEDNATKLADNLTEANRKVENLTADLSEAQANASKLNNDLADANKKADDLATELADAQDNVTKLTDNLADANAKVDNLTTELDEAQANVTQLTNDLADANAKVDNLTSELNQTNVTQLTNDLAEATQKVNNLTTQLEEAQTNATKLAEDLDDANAKVENLTTQLEEAQDNTTKLADNLTEANRKVENLTAELEDAQGNATKLSNDLADANKKADDLTTELADAQANATKLTDDLTDANKKIENLTNELTDAKDNATQLNKELSDANKKVENLTTQLADAQSNVTVVVDGTKYPVNVVNGTVTIKTNGTQPVVKKDTVIVANQTFSCVAVDYNAGERGAMFYGVLKDSEGNALVNKTVQIAFNGKIYNKTTDDQGRAGLQVNLASANTYTFALSFQGDDQYNAASIASSKIIVTKKKTTIKAAKKAFKAKTKTKKVTVTLKTVKNPYDGKTYLKSGKKVTLKVNGKTYTAKINSKGKATFKITKLTKKGKYTATIKFAGDKTYKASTKKIKITVK